MRRSLLREVLGEFERDTRPSLRGAWLGALLYLLLIALACFWGVQAQG